MKKFVGWALVAAGSWMLVAPQSLTGLKGLRWMAATTFPGEVLVGIVVLAAAYYFMDFPVPKMNDKPSH
jgi:hypothetical protein